MTRDDIRALARALPESVEQAHHGIPSFRVAGKIFCTLHLELPRMMVKLDPEDQRNLCQAHPGIVQPVPGYWGRKGSTFVAFERCGAAVLKTLLRLAWSRAAPQRLRAAP